ncbi:MAG: hypothetical protein LBR27_01480 [Bifidobacteriaceae bacterium]|jgi:hypothetical protein|nr:hypothetical protein [Bifidobacteriaceae bacterium]
MHRSVYRLKARPGSEARVAAALGEAASRMGDAIGQRRLLTASVFRYGRDFFAYYESLDGPGCPMAPAQLFGDLTGLVETWPGEAGPQAWTPMVDIYHASRPVSPEDWARPRPVAVLGQVNRLRPEMVSSYVFYHFQYQEEKPGDWAKYAAIYLHGNLMFFYQEQPDGPVAVPYRGSLDTHNTPADWQGLMAQHFLPWEDDPNLERPWRDAETVLSVW